MERDDLAPMRGCSFLVIEDDPDARDVLRRLLESLGARVVTAANGLEGLDRLRAGEFDAVLCDLGMPLMDGLEFGREMRRDAHHQRALLIAVTGRQDHSSLLQTWDAGFDAHLVKPVTLEMLRSVARRLAGRCRGQARAQG